MFNRHCCRPAFFAAQTDDAIPPGPRGECSDCGKVQCTGCERFVPVADASTVQWVPGEWAPAWLCEECLVEDTDGVPEEVPEEETSAQTVRTTYEPIGAEGLGDVRATRRAA